MKCTALLACEKLIIDKDGAHSIINVMLRAQVAFTRTLQGQGEDELPIPPNMTSPNMWWIYTAWMVSPEDVGRSFEQKYEIFWPDGEKFADTRLPFVQKDTQVNQTSFYLVGFPVGQKGKVKIRTWIDFEGSPASEISETFVEILHGVPSDSSTRSPSYAIQGSTPQ
jgi:hypothetical protein